MSLRLRIFAGPNGSGKSTIINGIREYTHNGYSLDFGIYINADDIAKELRKGSLKLSPYQIRIDQDDFHSTIIRSGLIHNDRFAESDFKESYLLTESSFSVIKHEKIEYFAQILSYYFRLKLVKERKKCSLETVFSHPDKIEFIKLAISLGYKVYFYFVCTDDYMININRVKERVAKGGHDVSEEKIKDRYFRSLGLLHEASQLAYKAYFFDNSNTDGNYNLFASFSQRDQKKKWDINEKEIPDWFFDYYIKNVV